MISRTMFFFVKFTGIPVWIGRKLHTRYRLSGKHKRNFAMLGGVAASVSISLQFSILIYLPSESVKTVSWVFPWQSIQIVSKSKKDLKKKISFQNLLFFSVLVYFMPSILNSVYFLLLRFHRHFAFDFGVNAHMFIMELILIIINMEFIKALSSIAIFADGLIFYFLFCLMFFVFFSSSLLNI